MTRNESRTDEVGIYQIINETYFIIKYLNNNITISFLYILVTLDVSGKDLHVCIHTPQDPDTHEDPIQR